MRKEGSRVPSAENVCFTPCSLAVAVTRCAATRFMSPDMELVTSRPEFSDLDGKCHFLFAKHALVLMCVQNNFSSTFLLDRVSPLDWMHQSPQVITAFFQPYNVLEEDRSKRRRQTRPILVFFCNCPIEIEHKNVFSMALAFSWDNIRSEGRETADSLTQCCIFLRFLLTLFVFSVHFDTLSTE